MKERQFREIKFGMMKGEGSQLTHNLYEKSFRESLEFYSDFGADCILNRSTVSITIPAYNEEKTWKTSYPEPLQLWKN